jgi:hypothetical protein
MGLKHYAGWCFIRENLAEDTTHVRLTCSSAAARQRVMRAAGAQWQRRACGAHATPCHGPLQLLVMRLAHRTLLPDLAVNDGVYA